MSNEDSAVDKLVKRRRVLPSTLLPHAQTSSDTHTDNSNLPLLSLPSDIRVHLAVTPEQCESVAERMLTLARAVGVTVWGFDIEWWVNFEVGPQRSVALVQFHRGKDVCLFHLSRCGGVSPALVEILTSKTIFKVGISISGDKQKLERDFHRSVRNNMFGYVCLHSFMERGFEIVGLELPIFSGRGLADMVNHLLGKSLDKSNALRRSNWELELSKDQVRYAALDAFANSALFEVILARITKVSQGLENFNVPRVLGEVALVPSLFPYYIEPDTVKEDIT